MRLLMITRKVDQEDVSPAGFTYGWVKKLGENLDFLYVLTWQESNRGSLPENVKIESLPKNKLAKIILLQIKLLKILPKVDGIFCHQNPEYTILSAPLAKIFRKKIISWYTHKAVGYKLHLVNLLADKILTASEKSCRLKNRKKIIVTGHGIDINYFKPSEQYLPGAKFKIVSIGRISPTKNYETLIKAVGLLKDVELKIVGQPSLERDEKYFEDLKQLAKGLNVEFVGGVPHSQILPYYQNCDLFINLSGTGSIDKAVLEAMACEKLVLTSNEAFQDGNLLFRPKDYQDLARKITDLVKLPVEIRRSIGREMRKIVVENHNLDNLAKKIISFYELPKN